MVSRAKSALTPYSRASPASGVIRLMRPQTRTDRSVSWTLKVGMVVVESVGMASQKPRTREEPEREPPG